MAGGTLAVDMQVRGQEKFNRLAKRLKAAGAKGLQRQLTAAVRKEGTPALAATRAAWRTIDVTPPAGSTGQSTGLRARVAAATKIGVRQTGIRIWVNGKQVDPEYGYQLVYGLDDQRRWRHPLFGNRRHWYSQQGQEVFYSTLNRFSPQWREGIEKAMEEIAREIAG